MAGRTEGLPVAPVPEKSQVPLMGPHVIDHGRGAATDHTPMVVLEKLRPCTTPLRTVELLGRREALTRTCGDAAVPLLSVLRAEALMGAEAWAERSTTARKRTCGHTLALP